MSDANEVETGGANQSSLVNRMIRAAKLDVSLYEEVEADESAMGQAMTVVVLSSLAAGLGGLGGGIMGIIAMIVASLVGWFIWAFLTYIIGTKLLPEEKTEADLGQLLRTIGFASSPGLLRVFGFIPILGGLISFAAGIWMLVAMVIAVRQALDYESTPRAIGVCVIGWVIQMVIFVGIGVVLTVMAVGGAAVAGIQP